MAKLGLYKTISNLGFLNYRAKIMVVAFLGTHIPLLGIIAWSVLNLTADPGLIWGTLAVALVATLGGTGATLLILNGLLQPVVLTSKALRSYAETRALPDLPTDFTDEAGTLMADANRAMTRLDAAITELESTDPITGLANRAKMSDIIDTRLDQGEGVAVAVIRSETLGKLAASFDTARADVFMRALADRLRAFAPVGASLARIDDQTLALTLAETDRSRVKPLVGAMIAEMTRKIAIEGLEAAPKLAIGIAIAPKDGARGEILIDAAMAASASATASGQITFFTREARDQMRQEFVLEQEMRTALKHNQFALHFQPVVDLSKGRAVGAEALIRWNHPEMGMVSPGKFIPLAERSGLIDDIGLWVLREACAQMGRWREAGVDPMRVAVNLSASQFLDSRLEGFITESLAASGTSPDQLEIELTESAAMADYEYSHRMFRRLKDMGVSVAIDDFGTGYASMSYLRKLPFDKLKIDREFVSHVDTDSGNQAICDAVIALSKGLGLNILAEGTERVEEVRYLRNRGCDLFQGFYFSKPVRASEVAEACSDIAMLAQAHVPAVGATTGSRKAG